MDTYKGYSIAVVPAQRGSGYKMTPSGPACPSGPASGTGYATATHSVPNPVHPRDSHAHAMSSKRRAWCGGPSEREPFGVSVVHGRPGDGRMRLVERKHHRLEWCDTDRIDRIATIDHHSTCWHVLLFFVRCVCRLTFTRFDHV